MSNTYSIGCRDCRVHMWIGQGWSIDNGHLYTKYAKNIYRFLFEHKGHSLIFDNNCDSLFVEDNDLKNLWKEISVEKYEIEKEI